MKRESPIINKKSVLDIPKPEKNQLKKNSSKSPPATLPKSRYVLIDLRKNSKEAS